MVSRPSIVVRMLHASFLSSVLFFVAFSLLSAQAQVPRPNGGGADAPPPKPSFLVARSVPVAGTPAAVVAVDLNNDRHMDMVVADAQGGSVKVFLGKVGGGFGPAATYTVGAHPVSIAVADFNGDGKSDIAVANQGGNSVSILMGNGDGTLQAAVTYSLTGAPVFVAAGDLRGQGHPDLVVAIGGAGAAVLANNGDGSFHPAKSLSVGAGSQSLALGDFNGDGKLDLVTANSDGSMTIAMGDGKGGFAAGRSYPLGVALSAIVAADFDHDGHMDVAVADSAGDSVQVLRGNGDGTFQVPVSMSVGHEPFFLAVADFDGNGSPDLAVVNRSDNTVSILMGNGDGSFQTARDFVVGNSPMMAAIADFDGDGHPDFATANFGDGSISAPLGNGDGTFQAARIYRPNLALQTIVSGDLNGDGHADLVVINRCAGGAACAGNGKATVFLSDGKGGFQQSLVFDVSKGTVAVALADLNGDKKLDLVTAGQGDNTVTVMPGNGDGTFGPGVSFSLGATPVALAVADFDHDGKADVLVATQCGTTCGQPGSVSLLLGNGDGSLHLAGTYPAGFAPSAIAVGDLNGDGHIDAAVMNACGSAASCANGAAGILLGDGAGNFTAGKDVQLCASPSSIAIGKLRSKGALDLLVACQAGDQIGVLLGNGDGSFQALTSYAVGSSPSTLLAGDFDGDGILDVAVANLKSSTVSLLSGNGDGTLKGAVSYAVGSAPGAIVAAAGTAAGKPDIVSANGSGLTAASQITVLRNLAPLSALTPTSTSLSASAASPVTYGTSVTFTATVTFNSGSNAVNEGSVTFTDTFNSISTDLCANVAVDINTGMAPCTATLAAGSHSVVAVYVAIATFATSTSSAMPFTVNQASLTVTADDKTRLYGNSNPALSYAIGGLVNGDTLSVVSGTASCATTATPTSPVGTYPITCTQGTLAADNYSFSFAAGTLTVNQASLTVTANDGSKTYGQTVTFTGTEFTTAGLVNGDTVTSVTLTSAGAAATAQVSGSPYAIAPSAAVGSGLSNYSITYANGSLTVNTKPLTVTANDGSKTYGQTVIFTGTEFTTAGLVNGDTVTSVTLTSTGAAATAQVSGSPYAIVPSAAVGSGLSNYSITYANGSLTVNTKPLTITANNGSKTYGQTVTFTGTEFTTAGLVNADTVTSVTLTSAGAAATAQVGGSPYPIVPSAAVGSGLSNYSITYVNGSLTVNTKPLTITANNGSKTYGQTVIFAGTEFTTAGLVNGDTVTSVTLTSTGAAATAQVSGSPYAIAPSAAVGSGLNNYSITYVNGSLTVNTKPLTVTANDGSKTYGQTVIFAGTEFTTAGLVNADTVTSVTLTSAGAAAAAQVSGSPYSIVPSAAVGSGLSNYNITYANGSLTVNLALLAVTADNKSRLYGDPNPSLTFTFSGFKNGETSAVVSGSPVCTTPATLLSPIGTYPITCTLGTLAAANYSFGFTGGTLTVNRAPLTVTADSFTREYGNPNPTLTFQFAGFKNGEDPAVLSGTPSCSTPAVPASPVGGYPITCTLGTLAAANYSFNFTPGALTVIQATNTAMSVTVAATATNNGSTVTFNIVVATNPGGTPTGTVTVTDDMKALPPTTPTVGACPPGAAAGTSCATVSFDSGSFAINAQTIAFSYSGDTNVKPPLSSFKSPVFVDAVIPTTPGSPIAVQQVSFTDNGLPHNPLVLTCTVQSATVPSSTLSFPKCSMDKASLVLPNIVNLTISTTAGTSASLTGAPARFNWGSTFIGIAGFVLLAGANRRKRSVRKTLTILACIGVLSIFMLFSGCGGGGFSNPTGLQPPVGGGTPAGLYVVTVTGTDSGKTVVVATVPVKVGV